MRILFVLTSSFANKTNSFSVVSELTLVAVVRWNSGLTATQLAAALLCHITQLIREQRHETEPLLTAPGIGRHALRVMSER